MKIEFLNADLTEARVMRGALWWKRTGVLQREFHGGVGGMWFTKSNQYDKALSRAIERARSAQMDWQPVSALPEAKAVRRG